METDQDEDDFMNLFDTREHRRVSTYELVSDMIVLMYFARTFVSLQNWSIGVFYVLDGQAVLVQY